MRIIPIGLNVSHVLRRCRTSLSILEQNLNVMQQEFYIQAHIEDLSTKLKSFLQQIMTMSAQE